MGDFDLAAQAARNYLEQLNDNLPHRGVGLVRPVFLVHVQEDMAGGLVEIERLALKEVFEGCGARPGRFRLNGFIHPEPGSPT